MKKNPYYVEPYHISVSNFGSGDRLTLGKQSGQFDLEGYLQKAFENWPQEEAEELKVAGDNSNNVALFIVTSNFNFKRNAVYGRFDKGNFGTKYDLRNYLSKKKTGTKGKDDFVCVPFMFYFHIMPGEKHAILLLQYYGNDGIKTEITSRLNRFSATQAERFTIAINPAFSAEQAQSIFEKEMCKSFRIRKFFRKKHDEDQYEQGEYYSQNDLVVSIIISTGRSNSENGRKLISDFVKGGDGRIFEALGLGDPEPEDELTAEFRTGGRLRKINYQDMSGFKPYYELDKSVKLDDNGNIDFESFVKFAKKLAEKIHSQLDS